MKNILVIFTGGTIGSTITDNIISPNKSTSSLLINKYNELYDDNECVFDVSYPYSILSENLSATELNILIKEIKQNIEEEYDGIIVTHGTDTIQYTAAALDYIFCDIEIPILIVSSNYPLENVEANGLINFAAAIKFIEDNISNGVFVAYENHDGIVYYHRGNKLVKHLETDDQLFSIDMPFAYLDNNNIVVNDETKQ